LLLATAVVLATPAASHAVPITTLFNTGVGATGVPLANNASDAHYKYTSVPPGGPAALRVETSANGYPAPYWSANDSLSAWIGPKTNTSLDGPAGNYTYETTFDLTGFQASTASITGGWSADNTGVDILLNGVSAGKTAINYATFSAFTLTNSFISGLNKLDFIVKKQ
jgi:kynureninase